MKLPHYCPVNLPVKQFNPSLGVGYKRICDSGDFK